MGLSGQVAVAAALALLASLAFAVATVAQQRAAQRSSDGEARRFGFVGQLLRRPQWWAGTMGNGLGYAVQAVALGLGSLLIVEPILVTSLLFALPLGARLSHQRLPRAMWAWAVVLAASLGVFVILGKPSLGISHASATGWLVVAAIGVPILVICLVVAQPRSGTPRAALLAVAVGLLAGVLAVLTKAVAATAGHGIVAVLSSADLYALIAVGAAGIYLQQLAFQAGALQASLPVIAVLEPMVAAGLGLTLLHENLQASGFALAALIVAALAMTLATVALARGTARSQAPAPVPAAVPAELSVAA